MLTKIRLDELSNVMLIRKHVVQENPRSEFETPLDRNFKANIEVAVQWNLQLVDTIGARAKYQLIGVSADW